MFTTPSILDAEVKADAARENVADMIVGYVIDQLSRTATPVSTSEDLDDLVQQTRTWLQETPDPTMIQLSDFALERYFDFTGYPREL